MYCGKTSRKFISTLVLGVYLFAALLSQNFHHHQATVFKTSKEQSLSKDFSSSDVVEEVAGCLWCHFLYTGNSDLPQEFNFGFQSFANFSPEIFSFEFQSVNLITEIVSLRGPP